MATSDCGYISEYFKSIQRGEIIVGNKIKKIYGIVLGRIESGNARFDEKKACRAIKFIENFCRHSEGRSDLLKLELWQLAAVSVIFGVVDNCGIRIFREVVIIIGRKNGKTLFAAAIMAYMAYADGEYGANCFCVAPKLDQAKLAFNVFHQMVKSDPELSAISKKRREDIYVAETNTSIKPLAFSARKSDGFNPHCVLCDEIAAWSGDAGLKQYEVMKSAFGARPQGLIISFSTAGYINDSIYDELLKRSTAYLNGQSQEQRLFPLLYIIDDVEKWDDINELKKSNPNMGVSITPDYLREEIAIAHGSISKKHEFMCKYCNIKQNSAMAWLESEKIQHMRTVQYDISDFCGCYAVGGIDLSQTTDLTSCCVVIERGGKLYTISRFFLPENKIDELSERDGIPYRLFIERGILMASGDNYVDYHDCYDFFIELVKKHKIYPLVIGYDRYSAQYLIQDLNKSGFKTDDVFQGENLTPVLHEFDGMVRDRTIYVDNDLMAAHILNVAVKMNVENRKIRPVKIAATAHIDGFVSIIDALTVRQKWHSEMGRQLQNAKRGELAIGII